MNVAHKVLQNLLAKPNAVSLTVFGFACLGLYALAGILQWHLEEKLNVVTGAILLVAAALLLWTPLGLAAHAMGVLLLVSIIVWQRKQSA